MPNPFGGGGRLTLRARGLQGVRGALAAGAEYSRTGCPGSRGLWTRSLGSMTCSCPNARAGPAQRPREGPWLSGGGMWCGGGALSSRGARRSSAALGGGPPRGMRRHPGRAEPRRARQPFIGGGGRGRGGGRPLLRWGGKGSGRVPSEEPCGWRWVLLSCPQGGGSFLLS